MVEEEDIERIVEDFRTLAEEYEKRAREQGEDIEFHRGVIVAYEDSANYLERVLHD